MLVIPAIDLMGGEVVRLRKGDFATKTVYSADPADVARRLGLGAAFAVLGTAAVQRLELVREACARFPGQVVCGIDAKGGEVTVSGWEQGTGLPAAEVARR